MSTSPCTIAPRHKWDWIKNVNVGSMRIVSPGRSSASFSLKGLYKCQCGAKKHGQFNPNGTDLRSIGGAA